MRFDKRVTFVSETDGYYNPEKGEWIPGENVERTFPCNVSKLGIDRTNQIFGQIDKVMSVIRLQQPYYKDFKHLYLGDNEKQTYQPKRQSNYRKGVIFVEGEV